MQELLKFYLNLAYEFVTYYVEYPSFWIMMTVEVLQLSLFFYLWICHDIGANTKRNLSFRFRCKQRKSQIIFACIIFAILLGTLVWLQIALYWVHEAWMHNFVVLMGYRTDPLLQIPVWGATEWNYVDETLSTLPRFMQKALIISTYLVLMPWIIYVIKFWGPFF